MFSRKKKTSAAGNNVPEVLPPPPPTVEEIAADLEAAPVDDVVFVTRVPTTASTDGGDDGGDDDDGIANDVLREDQDWLRPRFRDNHAKDLRHEDDSGNKEEELDRAASASASSVDRLLAHGINVERIRTFRGRAAAEADALEESAAGLRTAAGELSEVRTDAGAKMRQAEDAAAGAKLGSRRKLT